MHLRHPVAPGINSLGCPWYWNHFVNQNYGNHPITMHLRHSVVRHLRRVFLYVYVCSWDGCVCWRRFHLTIKLWEGGLFSIKGSGGCGGCEAEWILVSGRTMRTVADNAWLAVKCPCLMDEVSLCGCSRWHQHDEYMQMRWLLRQRIISTVIWKDCVVKTLRCPGKNLF